MFILTKEGAYINSDKIVCFYVDCDCANHRIIASIPSTSCNGVDLIWVLWESPSEEGIKYLFQNLMQKIEKGI
jgi:hypothetical protein